MFVVLPFRKPIKTLDDKKQGIYRGVKRPGYDKKGSNTCEVPRETGLFQKGANKRVSTQWVPIPQRDWEKTSSACLTKARKKKNLNGPIERSQDFVKCPF